MNAEPEFAIVPVRLGVRPLGSLAFAGIRPSTPTIRAIVNLMAITIEKARASVWGWRGRRPAC